MRVFVFALAATAALAFSDYTQSYVQMDSDLDDRADPEEPKEMAQLEKKTVPVKSLAMNGAQTVAQSLETSVRKPAITNAQTKGKKDTKPVTGKQP